MPRQPIFKKADRLRLAKAFITDVKEVFEVDCVIDPPNSYSKDEVRVSCPDVTTANGEMRLSFFVNQRLMGVHRRFDVLPEKLIATGHATGLNRFSYKWNEYESAEVDGKVSKIIGNDFLSYIKEQHTVAMGN